MFVTYRGPLGFSVLLEKVLIHENQQEDPANRYYDDKPLYNRTGRKHRVSIGMFTGVDGAYSHIIWFHILLNFIVISAIIRYFF